MNLPDERPDFSYLQMVSKGNTDFEHILIQSTLKSIEENLLKLQDGMTIPDTTVIKKAAHAMKPLFAIAGTKKLQHQCNELDQMQNDLQNTTAFVNRAKEIIDYWRIYQLQLQELFPAANKS